MGIQTLRNYTPAPYFEEQQAYTPLILRYKKFERFKHCEKWTPEFLREPNVPLRKKGIFCNYPEMTAEERAEANANKIEQKLCAFGCVVDVCYRADENERTWF